MFWRNFGFHQASGIDALLDRSASGENVALEAVLDDDDLLNECKAQNTRLIEYLARVDVLKKLLGYACGQIEAEGLSKFRYPHVATEVLCSEIWSILDTCLQSKDQLLVPFWDYLLALSNTELQQKPLIGPNFTKITAVFLSKKPEEMFAFIRDQPNVLDRILSHIEIPAFYDLIFRLIGIDELAGAGGGIQWLSEQGLIPKLAAMLSPTHSPDLHTAVAEALKGIISLCAPSPGNANDQMTLIANRFSRELASESVSSLLVSFMLDDVSTESTITVTKPAPIPPHAADMEAAMSSTSSSTEGSSDPSQTNTEDDRNSVSSHSSSSSASSHSDYHSIIMSSTPSERSTSSLISVCTVVIELMRKNNSDFFEPYLFHAIRTRLIAIQQQYLPTLDYGTMDTEERAEHDRVILEQAMNDMTNHMGIVNFGPLLAALSSRLQELQSLVATPRSLYGPIQTTVGEIMPLTQERFRICELYAELLHCSSLSLLNRRPGTGPLYDQEGRLLGGLSGLEELARTISSNGNEDDGDDDQPEESTPPPSSRSMSMSQDESDGDSLPPYSNSDMATDGSTADERSVGDDGGSTEDEEDFGPMEEINVHDPQTTDPTAHLQMPSSPQPTREPLPPAPFAVPSPRPSPYAQSISLPNVSDETVAPGTDTAAATGVVEEEDIDPFGDPSPTDSPEAPLAASITSTTIMEDSTVLAAVMTESIEQPAEGVTEEPENLPAPPGELFRKGMLKLDVLTTMLDLFFGFPMNNFLHNVVYDLLHQLMTGRVDKPHNRELIISLFRDARLADRILEAQALCDKATEGRKGVRLAYMGHLTLISEDVISALSVYPPDLVSILAKYCPQPQWDLYVSGRFKETKARDSSTLGGGKPSVTSLPRVPSESAIGSRPGSLNVDEIPASLTPGQSPTSASMGQSASNKPRQNVVFAAVNEDEEEELERRRASSSAPTAVAGSGSHSAEVRHPSSNSHRAAGKSPGSPSSPLYRGLSTQFASYLSQQINGSSNGRFASPGSSGSSDDEEDDTKWFEEGPSIPSQGAASASSGSARAAFDDSFGDFPTHSRGRSIGLQLDDFGPFESESSSEVPAEAQHNFADEFSDEFSFPTTSAMAASSSSGSFGGFGDDDDDAFANIPVVGTSSSSESGGLTFASGAGDVGFGDDDDDFGDFQGGGLEVVMSTSADGTSVSTSQDGFGGFGDDAFVPSHGGTTSTNSTQSGAAPTWSSNFDDGFDDSWPPPARTPTSETPLEDEPEDAPTPKATAATFAGFDDSFGSFTPVPADPTGAAPSITIATLEDSVPPSELTSSPHSASPVAAGEDTSSTKPTPSPLLTNIDPSPSSTVNDFFSFARARSTASSPSSSIATDPAEGDEESENPHVSNALSLLERSFGKVSVSEGDKLVLSRSPSLSPAHSRSSSRTHSPVRTAGPVLGVATGAGEGSGSSSPGGSKVPDTPVIDTAVSESSPKGDDTAAPGSAVPSADASTEADTSTPAVQPSE
ncbi:SAPS-domain-containing protein [Clavulina sp. PMI_390]|nr:SAPS-domain-containing protein [Clavulina sp. PMI_390]